MTISYEFKHCSQRIWSSIYLIFQYAILNISELCIYLQEAEETYQNFIQRTKNVTMQFTLRVKHSKTSMKNGYTRGTLKY